MKDTSRLTESTSGPDRIRSRVTKLIQRLKTSIEAHIERNLTQEELAEWIGEARTTLANWLSGLNDPTCEAILRLMEFLPVQERNAILDQSPFVREYPNFKHPRLAHDPVAISRLRTILLQKCGTIVAQGSDEARVTFVVTAIGHAIAGSKAGARITGIDAHLADWFVPVPGVIYSGNLPPPSLLNETISSVFRSVPQVRPAMILLNGVADQLTGFRETIADLSQESFLVIGMSSKIAHGLASAISRGSSYMVTVRPKEPTEDRIYLSIERH